MSPRIQSPSLRASARRFPASLAAGIVVLAIVAAACGGSGPAQVTTPAPSSAAPPTSASSSSPTSNNQTAAQPSAAPETPEPSVDAHGVPTLEALLPHTVGTVALEVRSLTGGDFYVLGTEQTRDQLDAMLANLDKAVTDLTVADAYDPTGRAVLEVGAFRVAGANPDRLLAEWVAATQASKPGKVSVSKATVDGRVVTKLVDSTVEVGGTTYAFAKGDTIFLVAAADPAIASAALSQLPKP